MKTIIERTDNYAKHYFTLLVSWFTFFVTVNWASLGWLAANSKDLASNDLVGIVAGVFAWQNLLALLICMIMIYYFVITSKKLSKLEHEFEEYNNHKPVFPLPLVLSAVTGMILAIIPLGGVWVYIWQTSG